MHAWRLVRGHFIQQEWPLYRLWSCLYSVHKPWSLLVLVARTSAVRKVSLCPVTGCADILGCLCSVLESSLTMDIDMLDHTSHGTMNADRQLNCFLKKTRRGKVRKMVREVYLRDDICCGIGGCHICDPEANSGKSDERNFLRCGAPLSNCWGVVIAVFTGILSLDESDKILVLDTNVVLHQIDFLSEDVSVNNVVVLGTVLQEVSFVYAPYLWYLSIPDLNAFAQFLSPVCRHGNEVSKLTLDFGLSAAVAHRYVGSADLL